MQLVDGQAGMQIQAVRFKVYMPWRKGMELRVSIKQILEQV